MPTVKLSVLCVLAELAGLTVVTDATACLAAVQLEDLTVVLVVGSQPASHRTQVDGAVLVNDLSHVLLSEQVDHWLQLPSDGMRIEIFILNQRDHLAGPVNQTEKKNITSHHTTSHHITHHHTTSHHITSLGWAGLGCYSTFQQ